MVFQHTIVAIRLLLLMFVVGVESLICPTGQQPCGSSGCYDPTIQRCVNGSTSIECIHLCNNTCYSSSQYCYNSINVCNNGELVCDVTIYNSISYAPIGLNCYNPSYSYCFNNTLCNPYFSCGKQCLIDWNSVCVNNETICEGFPHWITNVNLCGSQKQCYDNTTNVCVNETTICPGTKALLCGTTCYNPDTQICTNGNVRCINSCNGTCYSNSQYCYNNTKICTVGELVCDVKIFNSVSHIPVGVTCYNSSQLYCFNNALCDPFYTCGEKCLVDWPSVCVANETICQGFPYWNSNVNLCGNQQECYDNTTSICLDNNGTVCPIGNQLCSGLCYDPQSQYCTGGNNTIYCLNNPSSSNCRMISTGRTSLTSSKKTTKKLNTSTLTTRKSTSTAKTTTQHHLF